MSCTTVIKVWPGQKSEELEELRNSHGSAPAIWNEIAKYYLGLEDLRYWQHTEKLWPLYERPDMPAHHRSVLMMTYDNAIVMQADFQRAAADIRAFLADFPAMQGFVNHWPRIAELFETTSDCPAIGFWMTSICSNPFIGPFDDETEDYGQPDWNQFWSVYEQADKYGEGASCGAA